MVVLEISGSSQQGRDRAVEKRGAALMINDHLHCVDKRRARQRVEVHKRGKGTDMEKTQKNMKELWFPKTGRSGEHWEISGTV